jgi:hypothetical protein
MSHAATRLSVLFIALAAAAIGLPGVAHAHGGGTYLAGTATTAPTVDGLIGSSEWADAIPYTVDFAALGTATVRFVHTPTDLYVGVVVLDANPGLAPSFEVFFDNDHDGVKEPGDDVWGSTVGGGGSDSFYDPAGPACSCSSSVTRSAPRMRHTTSVPRPGRRPGSTSGTYGAGQARSQLPRDPTCSTRATTGLTSS